MEAFRRIILGSCLVLAIIFMVSLTQVSSDDVKVPTVKQKITKRDFYAICNDIKSALDVHARTIRCTYSPEKKINAYAAYKNGTKVVVMYQGMLDFVTSRDELSVVVGHEFAHHMLGHIDMHKYHGIPHYGYNKRSIFLQPQYREAMSDLLGMELSHLAGYKPCEGGNLWKRMIKRFGHSYFGSRTHPHTLARIHNFERLCQVDLGIGKRDNGN